MAAATGETIRAIQISWQSVTPRDRWRSLFGLLALIGLSVAIAMLPIDYHAMGNYGYLGVFVVTLISSAALVLPVPYLAAIFVAGSFLDPRIVALVAGSAAALGELTGYAIGYTGRSLLPDNHWTLLIQRGMKRFGAPILFVAALIPNPFFDAVGMIAGASRIPVWMFLLAAFLGKTLRFWILAVLGGVAMAGAIAGG